MEALEVWLPMNKVLNVAKHCCIGLCHRKNKKIVRLLAQFTQEIFKVRPRVIFNAVDGAVRMSIRRKGAKVRTCGTKKD